MSLFKRNRENKKLNFFVLTKNNDLNKFLCIALNKKDIIEYAENLLKFEHKAHFQTWCTLRNYSVKDIKSWDEYYSQCISFEEKSEYRVMSVSYKLKDVAAIMRMFGGCAPIGCSFETAVEYEHAKSKNELLEVQMEFERYWRENHKKEIEEAMNGSK